MVTKDETESTSGEQKLALAVTGFEKPRHLSDLPCT